MVRVKQSFPTEAEASDPVEVEVESMIERNQVEEGSTICDICGKGNDRMFRTSVPKLASAMDSVLGSNLRVLLLTRSGPVTICRYHYSKFERITGQFSRAEKNAKVAERLKKEMEERLQVRLQQMPCCICGIPTDLRNGARITNPDLKAKMNARFGTIFPLNREVISVCAPHWTQIHLDRGEDVRNLVFGYKVDGEQSESGVIDNLDGQSTCQSTPVPVWLQMDTVLRSRPITVLTLPSKDKKNTVVVRTGFHTTIPIQCCVCGMWTDVRYGVRISNPDVKSTLNDRLGIKYALNQDVQFVCGQDWTNYLSMEKKSTMNTVNSPSLDHLISGISTNKQEIKEEIVEEFGDFAEEEHQSIDMQDTSSDPFVRDEMMNVEQLIGQGQKTGRHFVISNAERPEERYEEIPKKKKKRTVYTCDMCGESSDELCEMRSMKKAEEMDSYWGTNLVSVLNTHLIVRICRSHKEGVRVRKLLSTAKAPQPYQRRGGEGTRKRGEEIKEEVVEEEAIDVKQLIGQGQEIKPREDPGTIQGGTVAGPASTKLAHLFNPEVSVKEEIKEELE